MGPTSQTDARADTGTGYHPTVRHMSDGGEVGPCPTSDKLAPQAALLALSAGSPLFSSDLNHKGELNR